jgi:hypothetical protein
MLRSFKFLLMSVVGAFSGYGVCTIIANCEDYQFYTVRKLVTGKSAMSQIMEHPADKWITPGIVVFSLLVGALVGYLYALRKWPENSVD